MGKDTAPAHGTLGAAAIAAALMLGGWCGPAHGASGVTIDGDDADGRLDATSIAAPELSAHTDTALADILDDEAVRHPALDHAISDTRSDATEESEGVAAERVTTAETPAIITRLPGVSEAVLPSFRRQMHRTDI